MRNKKIGIFDSGLGGLYIARAIHARLPEYDYVYLGDTLHLPYGRRSDEAIYALCEKAMRWLFGQGCDLVIMACNTASASALRRLQQEFLVKEFPEKRILGVVVPTLECAIEQGASRIGLLATQRTVHSNIYDLELRKINPDVQLTAIAAPLLVPLIEYEGEKYFDLVLADYLAPLREKDVEVIILGCTHYVALKQPIAHIMGAGVTLLSQDEIIPEKLADYLLRHPEMETRLGLQGQFLFYATDCNESFQKNMRGIMGDNQVLLEAKY